MLNWDSHTERSVADQLFCYHRKSRVKQLNRNYNLTSLSFGFMLGRRREIKPFLAFGHSDVIF